MQVGAADYIALAQQYHTVFITDIPIMSMRMIDKVCSSFLLIPKICRVKFSHMTQGNNFFIRKTTQTLITGNSSLNKWRPCVFYKGVLNVMMLTLTSMWNCVFFQARRFITLVDELYNHHCRLICSAAGPPDGLFLGTIDGPIIDLERLDNIDILGTNAVLLVKGQSKFKKPPSFEGIL